MTLQPGGAPLTIVSGIREFAASTPARTAVIDGPRTLAFAALDERSSRLAQHFLSTGLTRGSRVGVLLGNRLEYPEIAAGVAKAGLVMVPLNPRLTATEAGYILTHSECRALVLDDAMADIVREVAGTRGLHCLSIDGSTLGPEYESALAAAAPSDPHLESGEQDVFCIAYTSGTTGRPKGVQDRKSVV